MIVVVVVVVVVVVGERVVAVVVVVVASVSVPGKPSQRPEIDHPSSSRTPVGEMRRLGTMRVDAQRGG